MSQLINESDDVDRAIAEFKRAVAELFGPDRREIELLKARIEARAKARRGTAILRQQLCELMARQIRREISA